ncbi:CDP-alcohol phosphatidyltransferase family protein [candidate division KSB1 bacterium]|nr:MAG: CDP-alcohol phosphatidyltransferase family protein [candidate division KSB1 bacterium]
MAIQKDIFNKPWLQTAIGRTFKFLSPNTWTTVSLFISIGAFVVVARGYLYWGVLLFIVGSICDFIDGKVARYTGTSSKFGAFWDGTVDRFVDALIVGAFFYLDSPLPPRKMHMLLYILLFCILLPPFIVAYANHRGAVPDPHEKVVWRFAFRAEPLILLGVAALFNQSSLMTSFVFFLLALLLMAATVVQSLIVVYVRAKEYV